jgi:CheY-like chemotaxis protein
MDEVENLLKKTGAMIDQKKPQILVVDDIRSNIFIIESILSDEFSIISAENARVMWAALKAYQPRLILLDLMLPEQNGFEIMETLRADEQYSKIPVIVVTARDTKDDVIKASRLGAVDFLVKPIKEDVLIRKVQAALNQ